MDNPVPLYSLSDLKTIRTNFSNELKLASKGKKTSLPFIHIPLPKQPLIRKKEATFQVMSIGGSNFQTALATKSGNKITLSQYNQLSLPQIKEANDLFDLIDSHLNEDTTILAINFAQALSPVLRDNILDGILISDTKELGLGHLFGKQIGYELEQYLQAKHRRRLTVSLANDSVCLALSIYGYRHPWESIVSGIVGTGTNLGFFLGKNSFISCESGQFNQFSGSESGKQVDQHSRHPGQFHFEKEVAGAYLYQHFNFINNQLQTGAPHLDSTDELNIFAREGRGIDSQIARLLLQRSASLVATQIAGIYQFKQHKIPGSRRSEVTGVSRDQIQQLTFITEGSLFWKAWHYQQMVEDYLYQLDVPRKAIHFSHLVNSSLIGAARLITSPTKKPRPKPKENTSKEEEKPTDDHGNGHH